MNGLSGLKALTNSNFTGVAQYFNLPTIGGLYSTPKTVINNAILKQVIQMLDMFKFGIPIYPDVYEESGGNDVEHDVVL